MSWYDPRDWSWRRARRSKQPSESRKASAGERRGLSAAAQSRRTEGWTALTGGPNAPLGRALVRDRCRDLVANNPHAAQIIRSFVSNMVGTGIRPRSNTGDAELDNAVDLLWAKSLGRSFYADQRRMVHAWLTDGEVLAKRNRLSPEEAPAGVVPLYVQILESEFLDASHSNGSTIEGVEHDRLDRPIAYWLFDRHPNDAVGLRGGMAKSNRVAADSVIFLRNTTRIGQVRGISWLAPVAMALRDLDDYADAERVRKKLEACFVAFVLTDDETQAKITDTATDASGNVVETLEPGLIAIVRNGKDIRMAQPSQSGGYVEYYKANVRSIAAGVGSTYELISGDLEGTSYTSIRAGLVEFRRLIRSMVYNVFVPVACDPVWQWFVDTAVLANLLPAREGGYPAEWSIEGFEQVDRLKDAQADKLELETRSASLFDVWRRAGKDPEQQLADLDRVKAELSKRGLPPATYDELRTVVDALRAGAIGFDDVLGEEWAERIAELGTQFAALDAAGLKLDSDPRHTAKAGTTQARAGVDSGTPDASEE